MHQGGRAVRRGKIRKSQNWRLRESHSERRDGEGSRCPLATRRSVQSCDVRPGIFREKREKVLEVMRIKENHLPHP